MYQCTTTIKLSSIPRVIAGMRMNTQINVQKAISIHSGVIRAVVLHIQILAALLCEGSTTGIEVVVVLKHALRHHAFRYLRETLPEIMEYLHVELLAALRHARWMMFQITREQKSTGLPMIVVF